MNAPTIQEIESRLTQLYFSDMYKYMEHVEIFKGMGYKVLRNSKGQHKVMINDNYLKTAFGGIFGNIFGG